jgi:phospholipid/cholesterol/gamma-HCH transport system substrate-binding protein
MIKQAPSAGRMVAMVAFALSCVGILMFLWLSFGGSVPLKPKGYRVHIAFPEATQLAEEADVRISGVNVGKVKGLTPDVKADVTDTVIELKSRYAPLPRDTQAILRQKTLLGETYVELTPGNPGGRKLDDGGTLPRGQVSDTVELDEILRTFDPKTREALSTWLDQQGRAVSKRGQALNDALGNLAPFAEDTSDVLAVLRRNSASTRSLVRDTGAVFEALTERRGQLRGLIANSNNVFKSTAARDTELADAFVVLPTFLREARTTTRRVTKFADNTNPLVSQLRPAARELSPTLVDLKAISPDLRGLFSDLGPLIRASRTGLPALERVLDNTRPLLAQVDPWLRNVTPIVDYLGLYRREIVSFFALDAAATQASEQSPSASRPLHYLRTTNPASPEILAAYPRRLPTNRSNPYVEPGGYSKLGTEGHLEVLDSYYCRGGGSPPPPLASPPLLSTNLAGLINQFVFGGAENTGAAPPCDPQEPLGRKVGQTGVYPRLQPIAPGSR